MANQTDLRGSSVIPCLRYRDAAAAIDWLCTAFGFAKQAVYEGEPGTIAHAQLTCGSGMIMLGSAVESEFGRLTIHPDETSARETQSSYVVVSDPDAHYAQATAHGAKIVMDIKDEDYGGRGYSCLDCEGHLWSFGNYDPWSPPAGGE